MSLGVHSYRCKVSENSFEKEIGSDKNRLYLHLLFLHGIVDTIKK